MKKRLTRTIRIEGLSPLPKGMEVTLIAPCKVIEGYVTVEVDGFKLYLPKDALEDVPLTETGL